MSATDEFDEVERKKHADCQKRGLPHAVFLPRKLYEAAARVGIDMTDYVIQRPISLLRHIP